jgi:hypothetical protein
MLCAKKRAHKYSTHHLPHREALCFLLLQSIEYKRFTEPVFIKLFHPKKGLENGLALEGLKN